MNKLYNKITFENDNVPALNESNLNSISKAIDDIDDRLIDVAGLIEGSISMSYTDLEDKPSINGVTLVGNKTSSDLNISANVKYGTKSEFDAIKNTLPVGTEYIITDDYEAGGGSSGASSASNVSYDNTTSGLDADNVQDAIDEVFQSVSNGKELIADAITDKGVETSATDTFQTMATNISNISSSNPTVYDLNYVKDDMLFWVDGKSTGFLPYDDEELNETKQMVLKFVGSSVVNVANGNLGSLNTFIEGGGVNFPSRSSSSYVRFPSYIYTPSSVTFECYVKYDSMSSGNNECFSSRESGGWLLACLNGKPAFNTQLTNVSLVTTSPDDINVGEKHLLTGVVDLENGKQKLYVDGVEKASADITAGIKNQSTCIWLGNDGTGSSPESSSSTYAMIGAVYSARIYNKALTDAEVLQNYNVDKTRFGE